MMMTMKARWVWLLLSCLFFGTLGGLCDSSFAGDQEDPFTQTYDKGTDWDVTLSGKRVCELNLYYGDIQKIVITRLASFKSSYYFFYLNKSNEFPSAEDYNLELEFGEHDLSAKAYRAVPEGYTGAGGPILNLDLLIDLARNGEFRVRISGVDYGAFSIRGQRQGVARMIDCMHDVDRAAVTVAETDEQPRPDLPSTKPEPRDEPAPQRPGEGSEASSQVGRYDQGDNWYVSINKGDRVCVFDLSLGEQSLFIHFLASSSSSPTYSLTFVDKFPSEKEKYFYEIGGRWVISSGDAKAFTYKGKGYYTIDGLTDKFLNDVSQVNALLVRFDATAYGEYDVKGFRRGLERFSDCVREFGVSSAQTSEKSDKLYDRGDDWSVFVDKSEKTCSVSLEYGSRGLVLNSNPPGARAPYFLGFIREKWVPAEKYYKFEVGNERKDTWSAKARTFESGGAGFAVLSGLNEDVLDFFVHSKTLYATAKGLPPERYDLSGFGHAFERFSDCLKDVRDGKSSSPPKVRRMN